MQTDPRQNQGHINVALLSGDVRDLAIRIWDGRKRDYVIRVLLQPPFTPEPEVVPPVAPAKKSRRKAAR